MKTLLNITMLPYSEIGCCILGTDSPFRNDNLMYRFSSKNLLQQSLSRTNNTEKLFNQKL